jgi:16S rRNA (adenine1518-N6/adenine1519-N6)-dimethyltransferase
MTFPSVNIDHSPGRRLNTRPVTKESGLGRRNPTLLHAQHLRPKKSLGQNFLRDENICRKIVRAIQPQPSDIMLEIGPGEGALTKYLAHAVKHLVTVDVDERVVFRMRELFPDVEVVHGDVLELELDKISRKYGVPIRVVGNIPYNITSPILFYLLDRRSSVRDVILMVQKEVAQRLVAKPGSKDYGILSVSFQLFADVEVLFDVSPNAFFPKPDVISSIIHLSILGTPRYPVADEEIFRSMVRAIFGKRRKMLRGSLKYFCDEYGFTLPKKVDLTRRPEELSIEQLVRMSNSLVETAPAQ